MGKNPAFQYYPKDWRSDPVWGASLAARGLWHEMMDRMHESKQYGYLCTNGKPMTDEQIARLCGTTPSEYVSLLAELDGLGVPRRTASGIIFCKRMVEDEIKRSKWRKRQSNHRDTKRDVTGYVTPMSRGSPVSDLHSPSSKLNSKARAKAAAKTAPRSPPADPRFSECVEFSYKSFEVKHLHKPTWGGRDFKSLKELLAGHSSVTALDFQVRWQNYLASTEQFTTKQGNSLKYFCDHFDIFLQGPLVDLGTKNEQRITKTLEAAKRVMESRMEMDDSTGNALSSGTLGTGTENLLRLSRKRKL